jgi:alpha-galactosidase
VPQDRRGWPGQGDNSAGGGALLTSLDSVCEWGINEPWTWAPEVGNLWRTTGDIGDNWGSVKSIIQQNLNLYPYAKPGAWNDPDMLEVGNGGMTGTEYRTHLGMWAMLAAPLLIGSDLRKATPATMDILLNRDVIAIDQDPLGVQARPISNDNGNTNSDHTDWARAQIVCSS